MIIIVTQECYLEVWLFAKYTGFTEDEVKRLCNDNGISYDAMNEWYDGYAFFDGISIYNIYSVMKSI